MLARLLCARQRARTTSSFVQLWIWPQCGQVNRGRFSFVFFHNASSIVFPVGASLRVEGHRTRMRLITGPVGSFTDLLSILVFITVGKQSALSPCRRATSAS